MFAYTDTTLTVILDELTLCSFSCLLPLWCLYKVIILQILGNVRLFLVSVKFTDLGYCCSQRCRWYIDLYR